MRTLTTNMTTNNTSIIEPEFAGIERTIANVILWVAILFIIIPVLLSLLLCGLWWLLTDTTGNFLLCYSIAIFGGSIPFLTKMTSESRIYKVVPSQKVTIVTNDLPASKKREASDSREETPLHGYKLGEGLHVLNPFDQAYATVSIESQIQVILKPFRVTIGKNHMLDLEVKSAVATFKTNSKHMLELARIDPEDEKEREKKIVNQLEPYFQRFIEEECRAIAVQIVINEEDIDPAEKSNEISNEVEKRLEELLALKFRYLDLMTSTIGDIDKPAKVVTARDKAATVQELTLAAENMMNRLNNVAGAPEGGKISSQQAMDDILIIAELKKADVQGFSIDPRTLTALTSLLVASITALKSPTPPTNTH